MAVDVVVVNYKTPGLVRQFCESYESVAFPGCTLTIVDVGSEFDLAQRFSDLSPYRHVRETKNVGYGAACNLGGAVGTNDAILFANSDTILKPGFEECYKALQFFDDWGLLGPRQVDEHGRLTAGGVFGSARAPQLREWHKPDVGQCSDIRPDAVSVAGSLVFMKRRVWDELTLCPLFRRAQPNSSGAFLETPHYFEETYMAYHARAHGYKCVYYGPVKMIHLWHRSSTHGSWADNQFGVSQQLFRQACRFHRIECE